MKLKFIFCLFVTLAVLPVFASEPQPLPSGPQTDGPFRKVILDADQEINGKVEDTVKDPMELAVASDGRVFYAQRDGKVKMWKPDTKSTVTIANIPVFGGLEDGMLGIALDPAFAKNNWVYLNHSIPETTKDADGKKAGIIRVSRYTLTGDQLDIASEKKVIDIPTQREECCHVGGSLAFDKDGNLYIAIGDNTNPFASDGYSPVDERPGRSPWDAQKSSANMNDLRGGISRIHPEPDGTYTIPKGNLFPPGTPGTRPEVYVKGTRNGFRASVDQRTGILYWGDVGPDAGGANPKRGPAGFDEVMQARGPGFFGWPYFRGDNKPYWHWDFVNNTNDFLHDPLHPKNNSPHNTGIKDLPPVQPAFIWYPSGPSTKFPVVNGSGGRTAMAGPVYYFDKNLKSEHKLPAEFDHTLFIYEWSRNWIIAVHLDANEKIAKMERFCPNMTFKRPMDMELGADGCLYLIEYGTAWGNNKDTQIVRIEYTGS
jgi:cytochrome c